MISNWYYPDPRTGLAGAWDKFVGPGATQSEQWLALGAATLAALALVAYAAAEGLAWNGRQYAVAALLAFDFVGGVATNATSSAKRWYHRQGQGFAQHFGFVALHALQIALVAWLFQDAHMLFFSSVYVYLLAAAAIVLTVPLYLQRSVALLLVCGAIVLALYGLSPAPGMEWFVPVLFLKLLVSHLTREEPYRPPQENSSPKGDDHVR